MRGVLVSRQFCECQLQFTAHEHQRVMHVTIFNLGQSHEKSKKKT